MLIPQLLHTAKKHSAVFNFEDESEGTRKLFALAAPLFDILRNGYILFVDELDRSLHALLVKELVGMFQDPEINTGGAQLVFTTHDTSLFSAEILRRDQFWFTDKDQDQASTLYPLTDFSPRRNQALERGYLSGSFGAVPILKRFKG
jgi:AAA15 family ATPase/GTPase